MSDTERLEQIRARAEQATPGPWDNDHPPLDHEGYAVWPWDRTEDKEFAYHARVDIPWLLDQLAASRASEARLREALNAAQELNGQYRADIRRYLALEKVLEAANGRERAMREALTEIARGDELAGGEIILTYEARLARAALAAGGPQ